MYNYVNKSVYNFKNDADDSWEVKIDTIKDCSKAPKKIIVFISQLAKCKIDSLMEEYNDKEWLAYLIGEDLTIDDIFVPTQKVSSTTINNVICPEYNDLKIIGVIHSHNDMGTNFSPTDDDWINQNHNISICISNNSINGQVRWKTPCGALKIIKAQIKPKVDINFDDKSFINNVKEKIKEITYNWRDNIGQYGYDNFLTKDDKEWFDKKNKELNFDEDKTLEEELEILEENNLDDKETN